MLAYKTRVILLVLSLGTWVSCKTSKPNSANEFTPYYEKHPEGDDWQYLNSGTSPLPSNTGDQPDCGSGFNAEAADFGQHVVCQLPPIAAH